MNGDTVIYFSRKRCGKTRNCSLRAISPFPTMFSKAVYGVKGWEEFESNMNFDWLYGLRYQSLSDFHIINLGEKDKECSWNQANNMSDIRVFFVFFRGGGGIVMNWKKIVEADETLGCYWLLIRNNYEIFFWRQFVIDNWNQQCIILIINWGKRRLAWINGNMKYCLNMKQAPWLRLLRHWKYICNIAYLFLQKWNRKGMVTQN